MCGVLYSTDWSRVAWGGGSGGDEERGILGLQGEGSAFAEMGRPPARGAAEEWESC